MQRIKFLKNTRFNAGTGDARHSYKSGAVADVPDAIAALFVTKGHASTDLDAQHDLQGHSADVLAYPSVFIPSSVDRTSDNGKKWMMIWSNITGAANLSAGFVGWVDEDIAMQILAGNAGQPMSWPDTQLHPSIGSRPADAPTSLEVAA